MGDQPQRDRQGGPDRPAVAGASTMGNHFLVNTQAGYKDNSGDRRASTTRTRRSSCSTPPAGSRGAAGSARRAARRSTCASSSRPASPASKQEGELTQAMLKDIGVKLDISAVPSDDFFDKYVIPGNFDITPFSWLGTPFPISSAQSIYANPTKDAKGELQIQQNFARVGSKEIDDLMDKAAQTLDQNQALRPRSTRPTPRCLGPRPLDRLLPAAADDGREQDPRERRLVRLRAAGLHEDRLHEQPELIGRP